MITSDQCTPWLRGPRSFRLGIKRCLLSGVLVLVPFTVTLVVMVWLFRRIAVLLSPLVARMLSAAMGLPVASEVPSIYIKVMVFCAAILLLALVLYLVGMISTRVVGKRLIGLVEAIIRRVPVVSTLYGASKQVVEAFDTSERPAYRSVVLVEFPKPGFKSLGFLTGFVALGDGRRWAKVFVPTAPNPTTGFFELVPVDQAEEVDMTVEEAFKMILSVGLVSPQRINTSAVIPDPRAMPANET